MSDPARVRLTGPLAVFREGFAAELARLDYKPGAGRGDEHRRGAGSRVQPVPQPQVTAQRIGGGRVPRNQP